MKYSIYLILLALIIGCNSPKQAKEEQTEPDLKTQVMDAHNEVMPKMEELMATQKQLLALADSSGVSDSVMANKYRQLANDIKMANESMMAWMHNYDPHFSGTPEEVQDYLHEQLESIEEVKSDMLNSLEEGQKVLKY